jgi:hypothetical protein
MKLLIMQSSPLPVTPPPQVDSVRDVRKKNMAVGPETKNGCAGEAQQQLTRHRGF